MKKIFRLTLLFICIFKFNYTQEKLKFSIENKEENTIFIKVSEDISDKKYKKYIIKWGDTLSEISIKNKVTMYELENLNNIENRDLIITGEELLIPIKDQILK